MNSINTGMISNNEHTRNINNLNQISNFAYNPYYNGIPRQKSRSKSKEIEDKVNEVIREREREEKYAIIDKYSTVNTGTAYSNMNTHYNTRSKISEDYIGRSRNLLSKIILFNYY